MKRITFAIILFSILAIGAAPTVPAAPDSWNWGGPVILEPGEHVTYAYYFNLAAKQLVLHVGHDTQRCYYAIYDWDGAHWNDNGLGGNILKNDTLPESGLHPELMCVAGGGVMYIRVYSDSIISPKVRIPNPANPMSFAPQVFGE